ncbi:MAG: class I SAM-dependent methyltransferase [Candidatus Aenigmarchaeota archaeon]|nr:class I SAM-dependent methyltransferase [Candidatus Aenigmarchaeota archaeon]
MSNDKEMFEKIYEKVAVWTESEPPKELVNLIESGKIKPCKVLDVGCGEGFYAIYLASKGFDVTGIDISENAIKLAKGNAVKQSVKIKFMPFDVDDLDKINDKFDFVFEWAILHHIMSEQRQKYVKNIKRILNVEGKYLSICFNNQNPDFGAKGKNLRIIPEGAKMPVGTRLYYSSFEEMKQLFEPHFRVIEAKLITMTAGKKEHIGNYFFMEKM